MTLDAGKVVVKVVPCAVCVTVTGGRVLVSTMTEVVPGSVIV